MHSGVAHHKSEYTVQFRLIWNKIWHEKVIEVRSEIWKTDYSDGKVEKIILVTMMWFKSKESKLLTDWS